MYRKEEFNSPFPPPFMKNNKPSRSSAVSRNPNSSQRAVQRTPQQHPTALYRTLPTRNGAMGFFFLEGLSGTGLLQTHRDTSQKYFRTQKHQDVSRLPGINVKCTSMIIDSVNYSIDYSSPYLTNVYQVSQASISPGTGLQRGQLYTPVSASGVLPIHSRLQEDRKILHSASKSSNVCITMQYLGTGGPGKNELVAPKDELRMFQQICGGENLCVYRGYLCPGEHFQFLSKRHHKFPFSASLYINGIISARISTCCEYKYHLGFQQGKHGCFRVSGLSGGKPCFRCIKVHNQKNYRRKYEKEDRETLLINCLSNDSIAKDKDLPSKSQVPGSEKETQLPMLKSHQALHDGEGRSEDLHNSQRQELRYADKMSPNGLDSEKKTNQLNENRLHGDGSQVSTANIRKRLKKKRVPREDSDSEQENRSSKKDRHFRRSAHRTKARNVSVDNKPNAKDISAAESYLESVRTRTTENDSTSQSGKDPYLPTQNTGAKEVENPDFHSATSQGWNNEETLLPSGDAGNKLSANNSDHEKDVYQGGQLQGDKTLPRRHHGHMTTQQRNTENRTSELRSPSYCSQPKNDAGFQEWSFQEKLVTAPHCREGSHSDVELSDSSDTSDIRGIEMMLSSEEVRLGRSLVEPDLKLKDKDKEDHTEEKAADKGSTLQTQIADLLAVLRECDEVDQLVLRNTGMTDDLLELLTKALIESQSDIETINLNLNNLSSAAAQDIVLLLKAKPSLKRLLLFGNEMGDDGITELMSGLSDLLTKDKDKAKLQISPATEDNPPKSLNLIELDIGGNKLTSKGLWSVASFVRMNPPIQYLGLAQNNIESLEGWMEFFDSMKINTNITHMLLDENNLGDEGTRLLADMLKVNQSLTKIDLDSNNIGEDGAAAIIESLTTNTQSFLVQVSLDENRLCADTRDKINELLTQNF